MEIKGVGIGRGVAFGPVIRMAPPLEEPSDAPRAEAVSAESEIERVVKSLDVVNADLNRRAEEAANGDEGAKQAAPILQAIAMFASDPSLAETLATEPKILFLDEPAAGMNPQETAELTELIRRIKDEFKITIMLIEHDMNLVMEVTERIYVLEYGRLIAHGTPDEIKNNKRVIEAYLGGEA